MERARALHRWTLAAALALLACGGAGGADPARFPPYFAFDGTQRFVASRNVTGATVAEIEALLDKARAEGTTLVRLHLTHGLGPGITAAGGVDEAWAARWEEVFDHAAGDGIHVIPVFGVWADWNDGVPDHGWKAWEWNPLNAANGGPVRSPAELYASGSTAQRLWIGWVARLVARWQGRANVAAWEIFSELDLVGSAAPEAQLHDGARRFVAAAAAAIRQADPARRPVTASLAGWDRWRDLYESDAIDLVEVHLYGGPLPGGGHRVLASMILEVARALRGYGKPLLLGESGLDFRAPDGTTPTTAPTAPRATRHAVWAALVSGFMNGRALWWEDGYARLQYPDRAEAAAFVRDYAGVERGATSFVAGRDLAGLRALEASATPRVAGGAIGDGRTVLGWFRVPRCDFSGEAEVECAQVVAGESVRVAAPGDAASWQATFHDPSTGAALGEPIAVTRDGAAVPVPLPDFTDDVAFVLTALP